MADQVPDAVDARLRGEDGEKDRGRRCRGRGGRDRLGLGFGWHLDGTGTQAFEVRFEGSRVDRVNDGAEHGVGLTLTARW